MSAQSSAHGPHGPTEAVKTASYPDCYISIIVPTRNRPELLLRALEGMRSQNFRCFEVIVLDDGSTADVRSQYAAMWGQLDKRFALHNVGEADSPPLGPSVTRNRAIELATGEIIAFCDDDDFWTDDTHLQTMAEVFSNHPGTDVYIANQRAVNVTGEVAKTCWLPKLHQVLERREKTDNAFGYFVTVDELVQADGFAQLNILAVKKETIKTAGGFWIRTTYEEDRDFYWRVIDRARTIFFNPKVIGQHNIPDPMRQVNLSRRFSEIERWSLSVLVSQHIALNVSNRKILMLCAAYEGDIYRRLSLHCSSIGRKELGFQYAKRALAARISAKWMGYTMLLAFKSVLWRVFP